MDNTTMLAVSDNRSQHHDSLFHSITGIGYVIIGVLGVIGHVTLAALLSRENLVSRGSAAVHVAMAISNAGVLAGFPFTAASAFAGRWLFGEAGCQFYAFEGMFFGISSILLLSVLSVDRFFNIHLPQYYGELYLRPYLLAILISYLTAAFWSTVPIVGWARYASDKTQVACVIDWETPTSSYQTYIFSITATCFVLPYVLMAGSFIKTFLGRKTTSTNVEKLSDRDHDLIIRALSVVSMVTWTPFAILCLQFLVRDPRDTSVTMAAMPALVAKAVTAAVPLVYAMCSAEIRYSIKHMYSRTCPERKRT